ncbi:MAG: hypothetical protein SOI13_04305 [Bifidobacterium mongoliense]|jgi:hypothetical protein
MSKRNEARAAMRDGVDDEQIRRDYGFSPTVIKTLRASLTDRGPEW